MIDEIMMAAKGFLGGACGNEAALSAMCGAAAAELTSRLRDGADANDIGRPFATAAAMLALSMYIQLGECDDWSSFKAGNVSVSRRGSGSVKSAASALRRQAEGMLAAYLYDGGFDFRGVRG